METLGELTDKLSIASIRLQKMQEAGVNSNRIEEVKIAVNTLTDEINGFIYLAVKGEVPLQKPRYKIYSGQIAQRDVSFSLGNCMANLFEANYKIWNCEEERRADNLDDHELRIVSSESDKYNLIRSNLIDEIDKKFNEILNNYSDLGKTLHGTPEKVL